MLKRRLESKRSGCRPGRSSDWFPAKFSLRCSTIWKESSRMYRAVTRQIEVTVEPNFLPERSSVENRQYFWSYTIVITNTGEETVQLRTRHWIITDAAGRKQEVRGEGVVGEQPVLARSGEHTSELQ